RYRKLMSEHHPDKLIAEGVPDELLRVATERAQEITAAYEVIQQARGIK
ncbi:MAG: co-chaperone DjlA, partial [Luminiphilus sp.]|nr:co-chaperone DjlA [Luminiphilus sp.]